ncbi:MAG TPA: aspartyl/asparaginyl beta-hydroxylase domain-containing protein [Caulobacteraceae bacterium]
MTAPPMTDLRQVAGAGFEAMRSGDVDAARLLFERILRDQPADETALWGLALACRGLGEVAGQLQAVDKVLAANPGHLPGLLMKADLCAAGGDGRAAQAFYRAAVDRAAALASLPLELRDEVHRAEREVARYADAYEAHLRDELARAGFDPRRSSSRFGRCLDLLLGKSQVYQQSPTAFYFPELPQRQFYERSEFPWLAALEAKTDVIRDELLGVLADDDRFFQPYVQSQADRPRRDYGALLDNRDWSAFYLIKAGAEVSEAAARCPETFAAVGQTPLSEAPGRTPSVLFSLLRPGVRIPPHTGYTNARLICHLPLIVPEGCGLRVGSETRSWIPGQALIFDDSIEHEAWNESSEPRVVLLFDIWRPELTAEERKLVAATLAAVGSYDQNGAAWV